jgi:hypothetical protein
MSDRKLSPLAEYVLALFLRAIEDNRPAPNRGELIVILRTSTTLLNDVADADEAVHLAMRELVVAGMLQWDPEDGDAELRGQIDAMLRQLDEDHEPDQYGRILLALYILGPTAGAHRVAKLLGVDTASVAEALASLTKGRVITPEGGLDASWIPTMTDADFQKDNSGMAFYMDCNVAAGFLERVEKQTSGEWTYRLTPKGEAESMAIFKGLGS